MNTNKRKERFFFPTTDDLLCVAIVSGLLGIVMAFAAAELYRANVRTAAELEDVAANVYRIDVACDCAEVAP